MQKQDPPTCFIISLSMNFFYAGYLDSSLFLICSVQNRKLRGEENRSCNICAQVSFKTRSIWRIYTNVAQHDQFLSTHASFQLKYIVIFFCLVNVSQYLRAQTSRICRKLATEVNSIAQSLEIRYLYHVFIQKKGFWKSQFICLSFA